MRSEFLTGVSTLDNVLTSIAAGYCVRASFSVPGCEETRTDALRLIESKGAEMPSAVVKALTAAVRSVSQNGASISVSRGQMSTPISVQILGTVSPVQNEVATKGNW